MTSDWVNNRVSIWLDEEDKKWLFIERLKGYWVMIMTHYMALKYAVELMACEVNDFSCGNLQLGPTRQI